MGKSPIGELRLIEDYGSGRLADALDSQKSSAMRSEPLSATCTLVEALERRDVVLLECDADGGLDWISNQGVQPHLVYVDPPYASHRDYLFAQKHPQTGDSVERVAFSDRWEDGSMAAYVAAISSVIAKVHRALSSEGSFLLHVDPRGAPYLAIECDKIFGMGERLAKKNAPGFRNELIWSYGLGGSSPRSWPKKHDNILWYTKGSAWFFDPPMTPAKSQRMKGMMKKQPDVLEIPSINNMAKDRTGYPTQKPIELLTMLIGAHTRPGELVSDCFMGSGTTAVAAHQLGRKALCSDQCADAIAVARQRLLDAGASVAIFRKQVPQGKPIHDDAVFTAVGRLDGGRFVEDPAGDKLWLRDIHGEEGVVAR